jgi:hypothetical protein
MIPEWLRRVIRLPSQKVAAFCKGRSRQSDEQFVVDCALLPDPAVTRVAIAVRRAVAAVGTVDPQFIRADDVYPGTLDVLPLWDSMSWLEFILALEEELGTRIDGRGTIQFPDPERVSVREMVAAVYQFLSTTPPEWIVRIAEQQQTKAPRRAVYDCLRKHRIPHPAASQQANGFRAGRQVTLPFQERERARTVVDELRSLGLVAEVVEPQIGKEERSHLVDRP